MSAPYDITEVAVVADGRLRLRFADGAVGELDVSQSLRGPVFEIARTSDGFRQVSIDPEGRTVCWPGGADLAPDVLHRAVVDGSDIETAREMLGHEMQALLDRLAATEVA